MNINVLPRFGAKLELNQINLGKLSSNDVKSLARGLASDEFGAARDVITGLGDDQDFPITASLSLGNSYDSLSVKFDKETGKSKNIARKPGEDLPGFFTRVAAEMKTFVDATVGEATESKQILRTQRRFIAQMLSDVKAGDVRKISGTERGSGEVQIEIDGKKYTLRRSNFADAGSAKFELFQGDASSMTDTVLGLKYETKQGDAYRSMEDIVFPNGTKDSLWSLNPNKSEGRFKKEDVAPVFALAKDLFLALEQAVLGPRETRRRGGLESDG